MSDALQHHQGGCLQCGSRRDSLRATAMLRSDVSNVPIGLCSNCLTNVQELSAQILGTKLLQSEIKMALQTGKTEELARSIFDKEYTSVEKL